MYKPVVPLSKTLARVSSGPIPEICALLVFFIIIPINFFEMNFPWIREFHYSYYELMYCFLVFVSDGRNVGTTTSTTGTKK